MYKTERSVSWMTAKQTSACTTNEYRRYRLRFSADRCLYKQWFCALLLSLKESVRILKGEKYCALLQHSCTVFMHEYMFCFPIWSVSVVMWNSERRWFAVWRNPLRPQYRAMTLPFLLVRHVCFWFQLWQSLFCVRGFPKPPPSQSSDMYFWYVFLSFLDPCRQLDVRVWGRHGGDGCGVV
jgi:hypothetical protein